MIYFEWVNKLYIRIILSNIIVIISTRKMCCKHPLYAITLTNPTSLVKSKVSIISAVGDVDECAIHNSGLAIGKLLAIINFERVETVSKQVCSELLIDSVPRNTLLDKSGNVLSLKLRFKPSSGLVYDVSKGGLALLVLHAKSLNGPTIPNIQSKSGIDWNELQVITQPPQVPRLKELNHVLHEKVVCRIINPERLIVVHRVVVSGDSPTCVPAPNDAGQTESVVAVVVTDKNVVDSSKRISDVGGTPFSRIKKYLIGREITPRAIQCLAEN